MPFLCSEVYTILKLCYIFANIIKIVDSFKNIKCGDIPASQLSCSVGVAFVKNNRLSYDDVFCAADKAMYSAKDKGKNRYEVIEL